MADDSPTILLAGGGTGGHLYPGIAVAEALRKLMPDCKPVFLCTQREIDRVILEPTGFEFIPQPIVPPVKSVGGERHTVLWNITPLRVGAGQPVHGLIAAGLDITEREASDQRPCVDVTLALRWREKRRGRARCRSCVA